MVTSESNSTEATGEQGSLALELDRLSQLLETLLAEFARLGEENKRLQTTLGAAPADGDQGKQLAKVLKQLESERRDWEAQKTAIADRIEAILGKFQWLEAERAARNRETAGV